MAYFPKYCTSSNFQKTSNFLKFKQNCRCQKERKLLIFWRFLSILRLTRMFYITYINKILDWGKAEKTRMTFLQVGKLHLHKLYQNKHFSTSGMISPNSKRIIFSCSLTIILFNHLLALLKCLLVSPCPTLHISSITFFVCNSKAGVYA